MRYKETGNVHKDFHLAMNTSIQYVVQTYGMEFLRELFRRTAQLVYRDIYTSLVHGDWKPLLQHWQYYYDREGGRYDVAYKDEGFVFDVHDCPAAAHLKAKGVPLTPSFFLQDQLLNDGWAEGTPFRIETKLLGETSYRMTVSPRG